MPDPIQNTDAAYADSRQRAADAELARQVEGAYPDLTRPVFQPPDQPQGVTREQLKAKQAGQEQEAEAAGANLNRLETATGVAEGAQKGLAYAGAGVGLALAGVPTAAALLGAPFLAKAQDIGAGGAIHLARKAFGDNHPVIDALAAILGGTATGAAFMGPLASPQGEGSAADSNAAQEGAQGEAGAGTPAEPADAHPQSESATGSQPSAGATPEGEPAAPAPGAAAGAEAGGEPASAAQPSAQTSAADIAHADAVMKAHALSTPLSDSDVESMALEGEGEHALLREPIDALDMLRLNYYEAGKKAEIFDLAGQAEQGDEDAANALRPAIDHYLDAVLPRIKAARHQMGLGLRHAGEIGETEGVPATDSMMRVLMAEKDTPTARLTEALLDLRDRTAQGRMMDLAARGGWNRLAGNLMNYYVEGLLSTNTLAIKASSDALMLAASPFERIVSEMIAPVARALGRDPAATVAPGETGALMTGYLGAMGDAIRLGKAAIRTGTSQLAELGYGFGEASSSQAPSTEGTFLHGTPLGMALDWYGQFVHLTTRGIAGINDFAATMHYRGQLAALAYRRAYWEAASSEDPSATFAELYSSYVSKPPSEMVLQAADYTRSELFADPLNSGGKWGEFLEGVQGLRSSTIGRGILPFWQTPVNIFRRAMEFGGPTAALSRAWWNRVNSGTGDSQIALARAAVGSMMMSLIWREYVSGRFEGAGPQNPEIRKLWEQDGHQPYALKVDGYDVGNLPHPFKSDLNLFIDLAELSSHASPEDARSLGAMGTLLMSKWLDEQNFFRNLNAALGGLTSAAETGQKAIARNQMEAQMTPEAAEAKDQLSPIPAPSIAERSAETLGGSIVPTNLANLAHGMDPVRRQVESVADAVRARIPGYSKDLPPEVDLFGRPVVIPQGWNRWTGNLISVFRATEVKNDPVVSELSKLDIPVPALGRGGQLVVGPSSSIEKVNATPEQIYRASVLRGTMKLGDGTPGGAELNLHDQLARLFDDPEYQQMAIVDRAKQAERLILAYTHAASQQVMAEDPDLQRKWTQARVARGQLHTSTALNLGAQ